MMVLMQEEFIFFDLAHSTGVRATADRMYHVMQARVYGKEVFSRVVLGAVVSSLV